MGRPSCISVSVAVGVTTAGERDILGIGADDDEGAKFWVGVLTEIKNRGAEDGCITTVITDPTTESADSHPQPAFTTSRGRTTGGHGSMGKALPPSGQLGRFRGGALPQFETGLELRDRSIHQREWMCRRVVGHR